ncbi:MAG: lysophospholipid acyltransferase family protein [Clostridia bacterium]|nr:lysophospholipid acyltransferase family protein [Clostridia bacterium]
MSKPTLAQKLASRKLRRPPAVIYPLLANIWRMIFVKRLGVTFDYKINPKEFKGPFIVVSNHASRVDYLYTGLPFLPHRMNYVAGYNEFFRSHLALVFRLLQVIPKKNFTADIYCIKEITRIIKSGGVVCIFPEGMSSISGANQPVALGSAKLLKHFGVPVLSCHIEGGYLTNTKYCLDERRGKVKVTVDQLFTPDQLSSLTEDEITDILHEALKQDDYAWNKKARVAYDGHGEMANNLHDLLYMCPRCRKDFTMLGEGNTIRCTACGNGATLNEYYDLIPFDESCVIPETPRKWFDYQRKIAGKEVAIPGFELTGHVKLGMLPKYKYLKNQATSEIVGEGQLTLDSTGITYKGTRRGENVELHMDSSLLPTYGMCTDVSRFYTFFDGEFTEFYPDERTVGKWLLCTEETHRFFGGKWQNFKDADTRYDN